MQCKKLKQSIVLLFGFGLTGLQAQKSFNAAGGNATTTILGRVNYWSSSERNATGAWSYYFGSGYQNHLHMNNTFYVLAVSAF